MKGVKTMEEKLIYGSTATLEDLYELHDKRGFEFVVEDGKVTGIVLDK